MPATDPSSPRTVAPGIDVLPLRTPTLPPATHTNTYIVGDDRLTVFDPASPYEDEQRVLSSLLDERVRQGATLERIVLTHHHGDHYAGAEALRDAFSLDEPVPIAAHPVTTKLLEGLVDVTESLHGGASLRCGERVLDMMHTPGHAPGHLVFVDSDSRATIAGDMVAGVGTILIDPVDGDLDHYLASLEAMRTWGVGTLLPAHGDPLAAGDQVLAFYVAHRHMRTRQIHEALQHGGHQTAMELAATVYVELDPRYHGIAAVQITSHLLYMHRHGQADEVDLGRWAAR